MDDTSEVALQLNLTLLKEFFIILILKDDEVLDVEKAGKYKMTPPRDLRSRFILTMKQREIDDINENKRIQEENLMKIEEEIEREPYDELYGRRIHSWILIAPGGCNDEDVHFFVESTTGIRYELDCRSYHGIESVWNDKNYWVSKIDTREKKKVLRS